MRRRAAEDPTLLIVLALIAVGVVVYKRAGAWAQTVVESHAWAQLRSAVTEPALVVAIAVAVALVVAVRLIVTRRTLNSRVSFSVLPTDTFDPSDQAVLLFGRQLSAVPRAVRGWTDRRAAAVRVRLGAAGEGRMLYSLEVPARSRSALQAAAGAYDEVELRPAEEVDLVGASTLRLEPEVDDAADGSAEPSARRREAGRGDEADELGLDEREALDETPEASPWWDGDPGSER